MLDTRRIGEEYTDLNQDGEEEIFVRGVRFFDAKRVLKFHTIKQLRRIAESLDDPRLSQDDNNELLDIFDSISALVDKALNVFRAAEMGETPYRQPTAVEIEGWRIHHRGRERFRKTMEEFKKQIGGRFDD
jgi:hypothetical protein